MASLKANGGVARLWRHLPTGTRYALCHNGRLFVNPGGADGWIRSPHTLEKIERDCEPDHSRGARATITRTAPRPKP